MSKKAFEQAEAPSGNAELSPPASGSNGAHNPIQGNTIAGDPSPRSPLPTVPPSCPFSLLQAAMDAQEAARNGDGVHPPMLPAGHPPVERDHDGPNGGVKSSPVSATPRTLRRQRSAIHLTSSRTDSPRNQESTPRTSARRQSTGSTEGADSAVMWVPEFGLFDRVAVPDSLASPADTIAAAVRSLPPERTALLGSAVSSPPARPAEAAAVRGVSPLRFEEPAPTNSPEASPEPSAGEGQPPGGERDGGNRVEVEYTQTGKGPRKLQRSRTVREGPEGVKWGHQGSGANAPGGEEGAKAKYEVIRTRRGSLPEPVMLQRWKADTEGDGMTREARGLVPGEGDLLTGANGGVDALVSRGPGGRGWGEGGVQELESGKHKKKHHYGSQRMSFGHTQLDAGIPEMGVLPAAELSKGLQSADELTDTGNEFMSSGSHGMVLSGAPTLPGMATHVHSNATGTWVSSSNSHSSDHENSSSDQQSHAHLKLGSASDDRSLGKSGATRSTKRSKEGPRRTRSNRATKYSAWEAHTHSPVIKFSWGRVMERSTWEALGLRFHELMLEAFPDLHEAALKRGDKVEVVKKLSDMLYAIVTAVDAPSEMRERLQALAPVHLRRGVQDTHMKPMGDIVLALVAEVLSDDFTPDIRAAWQWLWSWISGVMSETLLDARLESDALSQSWDLACDRLTDDEIGAMLCESLTELAPLLKNSVFPIPRQILAPRFFEMLSTLRSFYNDHDRMREQVTWLAMRHMQYKARPEHVQTFGQCIVAALEQAVGEDDWTPAMAKAWLDLWNETCHIMMAIIEEAEKYGADVQSLWEAVKARSSPQTFGALLRKDLVLSGAIFDTFRVADTWKSKAAQERLLRAYFHSWREGSAEKQRIRRSSVDGDASPITLSRTHSDQSEKEEAGVAQEELVSLRAGSMKVTHKGHGVHEDVLGRLTDDTAEGIGRRIWELLGWGIDLLWEPEMQHERFMVAAKELHAWGLRDRDLDMLGMAVSTTFRKTLGGDYSRKFEASWSWFWKTAREAFGRMLLDSERDSAKRIRDSWEIIQRLTTTEQLAEFFFAELNHIAPHVVHLFKLPKKMQAIRLQSICELLIKFFEDPDVFFSQFKQLAIRHISYGVRADMTKPFGTALVKAIQKAVDGKLDSTMEHAWADLWTRASTCVTRSLAIASNLVVVALVQGDVAKLGEALDCAPRAERWMWLLKVKVNGEHISPLLWAIRDGRFAMAKFMIDDILALRADRTEYYFGYDGLWTTHPHIVDVLTKECSVLLEPLLDGHMWHSSGVEAGDVRVNYYLSNLYGDPDKYPEVWESPLAYLVLRGEPDIFMHPVVLKLLELKWGHFARTYFVVKMVWFSMLLVLFMVGCIMHGGDRGSSCQFQPLRLGLGLLAFASLLSMLQVSVSQYLRKQCAYMGTLIPGLRLPVPFFLANIWNLSRFCSCALLVATALLEPCASTADAHATAPLLTRPLAARSASETWSIDALYGYKALTAAVAILLWLQTVQAFSISTRMAAFSYTIGIMFQDVLHNLVVIAVFLLAFASALTAIDEKPVTSDLAGWILVLIREVLNLDHDNLDQTSDFGGLLLFMFSILTTVGMLNMLIAQLSLAYESMADHKVGFALKHRAAICVDIESLLSLASRRRLFLALGFDQPVPFGTGDDGPCGGIQMFEPAQTVRGSPQYRPDRIIRFTEFEASPRDPWPTHSLDDISGGYGEERGVKEKEKGG